jgi:hypothetical protein
MASILLEDHAEEEGTFHIICTFDDEDGVDCAPSAIAWTLSDGDGNILNGRDAVAVGSPATSVTITLQGTDLSIVAGQTNERLFLIKWTYNSTYGAGLINYKQASFIIDDWKKVT